MAIVKRRYAAAGPSSAMLAQFVGASAAINMQFPIAAVDLDTDDAPGSISTIDAYMQQLGYVYSPDARPVSEYRTYQVAPDGSADFTSIADAVNAAIAQGPTLTNPWLVMVQPGEYIEPPFTLMPGIVLTSRSTGISDFDALITASDPTQDLITMVGGSLGGITMRGVTAAGKALIRMSGAGTGGFLTSPVFTGPCSNGLIIENGAIGGGSNIIAEVIDVGCEITESVFTIDGVGSQLLLSGTFCFVPTGLIPFYTVNPIQTCFKCTNGGLLGIYSGVVQVAPFDNTQVNAYVDTGGRLNFYSVSFQEGYTALYVGAGGAGSTAFVQGGAFEGHTMNFAIDSATGQIFCSTMIDDETKKAIVPGGQLSGLFSNKGDAETQLAGSVSYTYASEKHVDLGDALHAYTNSGSVDGGAVTDAGGLTVDVAAGSGWANYTGDGAANYSWAASLGLALTANATNYVYIDGTTRVPTVALAAPPDDAVPLAIVVTDAGGIWFLHEARDYVVAPFQRLHDYLLNTRKIQIKSGIVSAETTPTRFEVGAGSYYRATTTITFAGMSPAVFGYFYNNGLTEIPASTDLDILNYDNAGVLTAMTAGFFRADTAFVTSDGQVVVVYGTAQYANQQLAEDAGVGLPPEVAEPSACRSALIIVEQGVGIANVLDARPTGGGAVVGGGGGGVTDHGDLTGLAADDHLQYLLVSGVRAMSGPLDMGGNAIGTAGTYNGVTVEAHAVRHQPGGADAIATAIAGTIAVGDAAGVGVNPSLARSDHTHALPAPGAPADVDALAAAAGASTKVAREDHKHKASTAAPGATSVGTVSAEGGASTLARSDHVHKSNTPPVAVTKSAAVIGVSGEPARADHKHDASTAAAVAVGTANAEGAATTLARSDHTHEVTGLKIAGQAKGDILYFDGAAWVRFAPGTAGLILQTNGAAADPSWVSASGTVGRVLVFGGKANSVSRYFIANASADTAVTAVLDTTSQMIQFAAGTIDKFSYYTASGNNTDVYKILKNGAVVATINATGSEGVQAGLGIAFAIGDKIAVQFVSGTPPQASQIQLAII